MSLPADLTTALTAYAGRESILMATDFDGVLAPLVEDPSTSAPLPGTVEALRALAALPGVRVAVVSGRGLAALRSLTGIGEQEPIVLIGSHGAEPAVELPLETRMDPDARQRLADADVALQQVVAAHPDTRIERKPAGVVLHTRGVDPDQAAAATTAALAIRLPGVHVMRGKQVVELSVLPVTKGLALQALAQRCGTSATCYLGDDVTDETAFVVLPADAGNVPVRVGPGDTAATYRIAGPEQVADVFTTVLRARQV